MSVLWKQYHYLTRIMSFVPSDTDTDESTDISTDVTQLTEMDIDNRPEQAQATAEIVNLAWEPDNGRSEKPLPVAVEANSRMIKNLRSTEQLEAVGLAIQELQDDVAQLHDENRILRQRIDRLDSWKDRITAQLDGCFTDLQVLLTASDLDATGICPTCNTGTLEVKHPLIGTDRIECANTDCNHTTAELKWV